MNEVSLSNEQLRTICKLGKGEKCCSYIACLPRSFMFVCAKQMPDIRIVIDRRRSEGTMTAKGNHCSGPPDYERFYEM